MRRAAPLGGVAVALALLALAACGGGGGGAALRVSGSTTVNPVAAEAAEALRRQGMRITVDSQGGSAGGIAQLAQGRADVAMSSKPVSDEERRRFAGVDFVATEIGHDAVGIVARSEVAEGGVTSLTREQARDLFESRVTNWAQLGGPDLEVFVYDKEPGRGTREQLDRYLYGRDGKAPPPPPSGNFAVVGGNEEARAKLLSTPGSVGPLSTSFLRGHPKLVALAVDGVPPTVDHLRSGRYPLSRTLYLLTDGPPAGAARRFVDHVVSAEGQALVRKHGFLTLAELGPS